MDVDPAREIQRRSYSLSWIGFALISLWLMASTLYTSAFLILIFSGQPPGVGRWIGIDKFDFCYNTGRFLTRGLAFVCLCGAWPGSSSWRRRAGLLVVLSIADLGIWASQYGVELGFFARPPGHEFLRMSLSMAIGWARFILVAGLAADFADHVGYRKARDFGKAASTTAATGAVLWFFFFLNEVNWAQPWPLAPRAWNHELFMLFLSTQVVMTICTLQLTLLSVLATRSASEALREMRQEDRAFDDPWTAEAVGSEKRG